MKSLVLFCSFSLIAAYGFAQDTFSIVAVDSITGEVGSAGASCLDDDDIAGGVFIISDLIPGKGAIHTQSFWNITNQTNARQKMEEGLSPDSILNWLEANDAQFNPTQRQYGIADFDSLGSPRAAAFTGVNCFDYKNHIVGPNYAIQGNILLGQEILDSMEARFLNTPGDMAIKLMAALQGANVPGADTRCLVEGVSSQSAFVRVAKPGDDENNLHLDLLVGSTPFGVEPIDSLQTLFNTWLSTGITLTENQFEVRIIPNPVSDSFQVVAGISGQTNRFRLFDLVGKEVFDKRISNGQSVNVNHLSTGTYLYRVDADNGSSNTGKLVLR